MTPELRELVGDEGTPEERERLQRVHDLLVAAARSGPGSGSTSRPPPRRSSSWAS